MSTHGGPSAGPCQELMSGIHDSRAHYRPDIQGLRGIAVLLVVIYHAGATWLPGGYVGVDVFFVISGFVIGALLMRELERSHPDRPRLDLPRFYARRMRRLLPAAGLVVLATLAAGWYLYSPLELDTYATSALATALYASNIRFALAATDYLGESSETDPFLHTWSLGVEEQFYLAWPLVLWLLYRLAPPRWRRPVLIAGIGAVALVSLAASDWFTAYNRPWGFFSPWTRAWEFGLGALAAALIAGRARNPSAPGRLRTTAGTALAIAGLAAIARAALSFDERTHFPGTAATIPVLGAFALVLAPAVAPANAISRLLSVRPLRTCGDVSYSWYLWHWPVFVFAAVVWHELSPTIAVAGVTGSFLLALATYHTVEQPLRTTPLLARSNTRSITAGLGISLASAATAAVVVHMASAGAGSPLQQAYIAAREDVPAIINNGCHLNYPQIEQPECRFGIGERTMVLFGDSHAAHWFPALHRIARDGGWTLYSWTKSGCPSFDVAVFLDRLGRTYHECDRWRRQRLRQIAALQPDLVVLGNAFSYLRDSDNNRIPPARWRAGARRTLDALATAGAPVLVLGDTPWPGFDVPRCLSRVAWRTGDVPPDACTFRPDWPQQEVREEMAIARLTEQFPMATFVAPRGWVCAAAPCAPMQHGIVRYWDHSHISARFSTALAPQLKTVLASVPLPTTVAANLPTGGRPPSPNRPDDADIP